LRPVFRTLGRRPHSFRVIVIPKSDAATMANPSCPARKQSKFSRFGNPPFVSLRVRVCMCGGV
jgi:hypothetical protein